MQHSPRGGDAGAVPDLDQVLAFGVSRAMTRIDRVDRL